MAPSLTPSYQGKPRGLIRVRHSYAVPSSATGESAVTDADAIREHETRRQASSPDQIQSS